MNIESRQILVISLVLPTLLFTTVVSPINVFGFSDETEKQTYIKDTKKDPSSFETIITVALIENQIETTIIDDSEGFSDLNLRWEPYNSFMGDDF